MHPPPQLVQWLRQSYPKPSVDENWLQQCYAWVVEEHNLHPATDMGRIKEHVESQLLMSDLTDSMIHGSGLPHNLAGLQKGSLSGPPVLVQIMALTEIGHSAFSLVNVRQTKIDRADFSGLTRGDNEEEADEGPVPNYPRSMLQFELSDGAVKLNAIEYRKIPQLDLENTPLGFKIQLKDVTIRNGIAFLEPRNIVLKGHGVEDLDVNRDRNFLRGLRLRLDPDTQDEPEGDDADREGQQHPPAPAPASAPAIRNAPAPVRTGIPDAPRTTAQSHVAVTVPAARANRPLQAAGLVPVPVPPGPSSLAAQSHNSPLPAVNDLPRRPRPPLASRAPRPGHPPAASSAISNSAAASASSSSSGSSRTSPHFSTSGTTTTTVVAPMMGLSPTRGSTAPLEDRPPAEPGSDWYFSHDGIDAAFLSRAASELERSEALLSSQSQSSQQQQREVIFLDADDDDDDKENATLSTVGSGGVVRRTAQRQIRIDGSVIDLSAEIIEGPRIHPPRVDNDDVISIGSDD